MDSKRIWPWLLLAGAVVLAGCGGSGGGGVTTKASDLLGTYAGTFVVTASRAHTRVNGNGTYGLSMQLLQGSSSNAVTGSFVFTKQAMVSGVTKTVVDSLGSVKGTLTGSSLAATFTSHYNAAGAPDPASTQTYTGTLTVTRGGPSLSGFFTSANHDGTITVTSQTPSTTANVNMAGHWAGGANATPPNTGGITVILDTVPKPIDLVITQNADNTVAVSVTTPVLGGASFATTVGGVVGSGVTFAGVLPTGLQPISGFDISGKAYTFALTVDPTGDPLTGELQINVSPDPANPAFITAATLKAFKQSGTSGGVVVAVTPPTVSVVAGATQQLNATVTGNANTAYTWSIQEGATGGTITQAGLYTAPSAAGTYHAVATSQADTSKSATVTITVTVATTGGGSHIFVSDLNRLVRMDDITGLNYSSAVTGGTLQNPISVAAGTDGNLYIADHAGTGNGTGFIVKMDRTGKILNSVQPNFSPTCIYVDKQNRIYWLDDNFDLNRMNNANGTMGDLANAVRFGGKSNGQVTVFGRPMGISTDTSGKIYVLDGGSETVYRFDDMTGANLKSYGSAGNGRDNFDVLNQFYYGATNGLAIDNTGHAYVADFGNDRIVRFDITALNDPTTSNFTSLLHVSAFGGNGANYFDPIGITVDSATGRIYFSAIETINRPDNFGPGQPVINALIFSIDSITNPGSLQMLGGRAGQGANQFVVPAGIAVTQQPRP